MYSIGEKFKKVIIPYGVMIFTMLTHAGHSMAVEVAMTNICDQLEGTKWKSKMPQTRCEGWSCKYVLEQMTDKYETYYTSLKQACIDQSAVLKDKKDIDAGKGALAALNQNIGAAKRSYENILKVNQDMKIKVEKLVDGHLKNIEEGKGVKATVPRGALKTSKEFAYSAKNLRESFKSAVSGTSNEIEKDKKVSSALKSISRESKLTSDIEAIREGVSLMQKLQYDATNFKKDAEQIENMRQEAAARVDELNTDGGGNGGDNGGNGNGSDTGGNGDSPSGISSALGALGPLAGLAGPAMALLNKDKGGSTDPSSLNYPDPSASSTAPTPIPGTKLATSNRGSEGESKKDKDEKKSDDKSSSGYGTPLSAYVGDGNAPDSNVSSGRSGNSGRAAAAVGVSTTGGGGGGGGGSSSSTKEGDKTPAEDKSILKAEDAAFMPDFGSGGGGSGAEAPADSSPPAEEGSGMNEVLSDMENSIDNGTPLWDENGQNSEQAEAGIGGEDSQNLFIRVRTCVVRNLKKGTVHNGLGERLDEI